MIVNGTLTYGAIDGGIFTWRFSDDVLNEVVIAVLLTIVSYQTVETMINMSFGIKARGRARLRDIQIMLLIRKSSPKAILSTVFPWGRRRRRVVAPEPVDNMSETDTDIGRSGFRTSAHMKLFCLLLAIPLVNVGSVVLSLEKDAHLTFADAEFGGLAFGIDFNRSIKNLASTSRMPQGFCEGTTLQTSAAEYPIAMFRSCSTKLPGTNEAPRNNTIVVTVRSTPGNLVFVSVIVGSQKIAYEKRVMILSDEASTPPSERNGRLFYLKGNLKMLEAELLVDLGAKLAQRFCDPSEETVAEKGVKQGQEKGNFTAFAVGACPRKSERTVSEDLKSADEVAREILSRLSFVNSNELIVKSAEDELNSPFINGDGLLLLSRRRALVSIPVMAILALAVVLLRIIAQLTTNNDLERGIGLIVRDGLGLPCCDSMLCSPDVVAQYDSRGLILYDVDRPYGGPEDEETHNW